MKFKLFSLKQIFFKNGTPMTRIMRIFTKNYYKKVIVLIRLIRKIRVLLYNLKMPNISQIFKSF
jgi:hypothetical protein